MSPGTPSLWEIYDTDKDLWRRGRIILATIGLFYFTSQCLILAAAIFTGNLERALALAITAVLFWLLFYFIWIGVHWIRWIWGGWNLILGFCMLIWAWRDESGMETLAACISLLIGSYLCLSPSVLFFARRQREIVRWHESLLIGAVCFPSCSASQRAASACGLRTRKRRKKRVVSRTKQLNIFISPGISTGRSRTSLRDRCNSTETSGCNISSPTQKHGSAPLSKSLRHAE